MSNNSLLQIESFDVNRLPELQGLKEKQLQIVKENPFVVIIDLKTYEDAKKARTILLSARTNIEKQDKLIVSKINSFKTKVKEISQSLIDITKPHEDKQQSEVKRWEEIKEKEKQEKIQIEEERKITIKNSIDSIYKKELQKIETLSFETIDTLKVNWEQNLFKTDVSQFEEYELDFNEKLILLKNQFALKEQFLREKEKQRLEDERLKAAREKLEADRKTEEEKLRREREELIAEKARLAKVEADCIARAKAVQKEMLEAEEEKIKMRVNTERLQALKPEKEKVIDYLNSIKGSITLPIIKDEYLKMKLMRSIDRVNDTISDSIFEIKNLK